LILQAKAIKKEQIIEGYANGYEDGISYMNNIIQEFQNAEQYYRETYGGDQ
jgi:hypothetical protein